MVLTRPQARVAFTHVLNNVLGRGEGSNLQSALTQNGIEDIFALSQLDHATIDYLQATTTVEDVVTIKQVNHGDKNLVKCFLDYVIHRNTSDNPIDDHWTDITQADFDAYCVSPTYMAAWLPPLLSFLEQELLEPQLPLLFLLLHLHLPEVKHLLNYSIEGSRKIQYCSQH
jgi:hypothetical protein